MFVIIVNPTAGGGKAAEACQGICRLLRERGISYRIENTTHPGHATELAENAVRSGCKAIVGVGGDGTLSEIVGGLVQRAAELYFAPCGTGNDFVRMLSLPADPVEAVRVQLDSARGYLDMATVNGKGFLNVAGTGFDVDVLREVTRFKHVGKGIVPYLLGLVSALKSFHSSDAELTMESGEVIRKRLTILSIANGKYFGGGMKVAPTADVHDGLLDVVMIDGIPRFAVPFLLPFFVTGLHIKLPICRVYRCKKITVSCPNMTFNMDGELYDMDKAEVHILASHLPVHLPRTEKSYAEEKNHKSVRHAA